METGIYTFRLDNYRSSDEQINKFWEFCRKYEIDVKHIGKSDGVRCHWMQITVGMFLANFIINNMNHLQLLKSDTATGN